MEELAYKVLNWIDKIEIYLQKKKSRNIDIKEILIFNYNVYLIPDEIC